MIAIPVILQNSKVKKKPQKIIKIVVSQQLLRTIFKNHQFYKTDNEIFKVINEDKNHFIKPINTANYLILQKILANS